MQLGNPSNAGETPIKDTGHHTPPLKTGVCCLLRIPANKQTRQLS